MRNIILGMSAFALAAVATPALAQDEATDGFTISGGAAIVSDYRFRGLSQTSEEAAVQGYATVSHESGFYAGFWGSNVDFLGNSEIDAIVGYSTEVASGITVDGGVTYYIYPGGPTYATDYFEPYLSVSGDIGPVNAKVGVAYAFDGQNALADDDNIYVYGNLSAAIPNTPVSINGHWGYSDGSLSGYTGNYADYSVGATASWKALTFGVSYVNTTGYGPKAFKEIAGADGTVVFSVSADF